MASAENQIRRSPRATRERSGFGPIPDSVLRLVLRVDAGFLARHGSFSVGNTSLIAQERDSPSRFIHQRGSPTTNVIIDVVHGFRKSRLTDRDGNEIKVFYDLLTETAKVVLNMLGVDLGAYGQADTR